MIELFVGPVCVLPVDSMYVYYLVVLIFSTYRKYVSLKFDFFNSFYLFDDIHIGT